MSRRPYTPWGASDGPPDDVEREPDPSPLVTRLRALAAAERARDARDGVCAHCGTGLDRESADCGGFGHGPDTMQGGEHDNGACPTCNGSGLATPFEDCGPTPRAKGPEECEDEKCPNEAPGETCSRCGATVADGGDL